MVREIQIRSALTELKLINVFKKREILNNQTEVIKMKKITSILLSIIMIYSVCFPITAFAAALPTVGISSLSVKENTVTVKWKKKSKIMGYQIQYSTDSKFKKNKKSIKIKKAKTTSKKISNLKESKKYYFRIRTYKSSNKKTRYSKWSKVKSIKTPKDTKSNKDNIQKETHCTNNNNHSIKCGNIGMWFGSRREVDTYFSSVCNKWGTKYKNEEITWEEYTKNCPQGYECWSCSYCGKWTGNFKYN
ncbi:MAG: fibronectin type III domain-containing protein [Eubacterium sp.]|nr:fibronectin type III domain-containing protein [Eubacterium sp.]